MCKLANTYYRSRSKKCSVLNLSVRSKVLAFFVCFIFYASIFSPSGIYIWLICKVSTNLFIFLRQKARFFGTSVQIYVFSMDVLYTNFPHTPGFPIHTTKLSLLYKYYIAFIRVCQHFFFFWLRVGSPCLYQNTNYVFLFMCMFNKTLFCLIRCPRSMCLISHCIHQFFLLCPFLVSLYLIYSMLLNVCMWMIILIIHVVFISISFVPCA